MSTKDILNKIVNLPVGPSAIPQVPPPLTVLSGVMNAPQEGIPDWKVAVISVTPKLSDPGAFMRRHVFIDRRIVALPPQRAT